MFPMLALCAVLSAVTVSEIGDLKDSDRVVTSVTGLSAVTNRIEDRLVPGPGGSLYADRTVKADLSVTDVRYFETVTPQVSTNYDITVEPIIEIIGHEYLNAPMNLYIKYSTAEGETILKSYGIIGGGYEWNTQSYPPSGKILGVRYIDLVGLSGPDAKMTVNYNMDQVFADEQVFGGSGHADVAAVVRESFIEVLRNRERTVVIPEIRSVAGKTVGISIRAGEADVSPAYTLVDIPKYGTNGWNVVTNSITVVTNGFVYATNSVCVATSLVTEDEMTNALASAGRVNVSRGETRPVFTNGTFGVIADVSVDSDALSPSVGVRSPAVIRIPDMQSVVVGGTTNGAGRTVGGKTLYSEVGDLAQDEIRRTVTVSAVEPATPYARKIASVSVPSGGADLYVPEYGKTGSPFKFIGNDLGVYEANHSNTLWDVYSSCDGSGLMYVGRFVCTEFEARTGGVGMNSAKWVMDMSTWSGDIEMFPFSRRKRDPMSSGYKPVSPTPASDVLDEDHPLVIEYLPVAYGAHWWRVMSGIQGKDPYLDDRTMALWVDERAPEIAENADVLSKDYPDVGGRVELRRVFPDGSAVRSHGLVPDSRKINGQPLTQDITIQAYEKPTDGIPKTDLESSVQSSLDLADTALQEHQDISGKLDTFKAYDEEHPERGGGSLRWLDDYLGLAFGYVSNGEFYPEIRLTDTLYGEIRHVGGLDPTRPWSWIAFGDSVDENTLQDALDAKADISMISATNLTFSSAVLAVGLNIDTNSVAVLNEIAATFGGFPITGTATTVGGLLAALAAAVAWLRKNKIDKLKVTGMTAEATAENGVAKLDDFFKNTNSLLTGTIDERTPYALSTGTPADRSIKVYNAATLPAQIPLPDYPTSGVIDLEVWIVETAGSDVTGVTFSKTVKPKDGKALEFAKSSTTIVHFTAVAGENYYTAVAAAFAAETAQA